MAAVAEADQVDTVQLCPAFCSFCFPLFFPSVFRNEQIATI